MIPLFKVNVAKNIHLALETVFESGYIGQGPMVEKFEDSLQEVLKTNTRPVTVNSCTSAIDLALELIGVGLDDEVIATPQTCFASNIGPIHRKAKIRWADINPITGLIDPVSVKNLITNKTKAIIAVNWAGKFCDYKSLKSYGIPVVEDAAHTWDCFLENKPERGHYICYSFQAIKFLTCGDGGILICPENKDTEARILRWYGLDRTKGESFRCTQNILKAGFKYHMNDISAKIGLENIKQAHDSVLQSRENSQYFINNVKNENLILPEWDDTCSYWLFSMHAKVPNKENFTKYLEKNGIASSPVHYRNDLYDSTIQFKENDLPGVSSFTDTQICIPNGFWLTDQDRNHIVKVLNEYKN